jgi:ABC-type Zn2+ transport system substrate-binding protein/surface adhesin
MRGGEKLITTRRFHHDPHEDGEHCGHCHSHSHSHTHSHEHSHDHKHEAEGAKPDLARIKIMLDYMHTHNAEHINELLDLAGALDMADRSEVVDVLEEGVDSFRAGNAKLAQALRLI